MYFFQDTSYNHLLVPIPTSVFHGGGGTDPSPAVAASDGGDVTSDTQRRNKHGSGDVSAQFSTSPNLGMSYDAIIFPFLT